jgi:ubiquinone/menaquinone biosynthesis C-methylase UbiE
MPVRAPRKPEIIGYKPLDFDYDTIGPGYYDEIFRRGAGVQSKWHHLKFRNVRASFPVGVRDHLDIGCGPGTFIGTLPQELRCIGTDSAAAQINYANAKYGSGTHTFLCASDSKLPFEDCRFDVVTLIELIEHLDREFVKELLVEARRVLRLGGRLVVTTPNYASLWPLLERVVNAQTPVSYAQQHISFFTAASLRRLLATLGFDVVEVRTFQFAAPFAAAVSWKLADRIQIVENRLLTLPMGFLLLGSARKH